jgi:hypothetical protein
MKSGAENRKKTIAAGALGTVALICLVYIYNSLFGGTTTAVPPPTVVQQAKTAPAAAAASTNAKPNELMPSGNAAGVGAKKMATTSASLDPTLDQTAMLRTESLVYTGNGRNIFSALYTPPVKIEKPIAAVRPKPCPPNCPPPPPPPPPPPTCPPQCPPIPLKYFGTAVRADGSRQAFLLSGEDVYLASQGDIIARKYKIVNVGPISVQVEDLAGKYTQTLPLQGG